MATFQENLVLSQLAYIDFDEDEKEMTIGELLVDEKSSLNKWLNNSESDNSVWGNSLESISDWKLSAYQGRVKIFV
jgi:hypothetical protein